MVAVKALLLTAWISAGPAVEIVEFTSPQCSPCRQMEPVVRQLTRAGYPIRQVDIGENPSLAQRFHVERIPCFVVFRDGQEVQRVEGVQSAEQLQALFQPARPERPRLEREGLVRTDLTAGPSPPPALAPDGLASAQPAGRFGASPPSAPAAGSAAGGPYAPPAQPTSAPPAADVGRSDPAAGGVAADVQRRMLMATVRIRVEDALGQSFGTGTIIDAHGQEALVLTCGHIFRESKGGGRILIDMADGGGRDLPGRIISYDLNRDVGLISFHAPGQVTVAPVGGPDHPVQVGDPVFSIGCDRGGPPTVQVGQVVAINKFLAPDNLSVSGQPVDGRSGGGLFDAAGNLIGVCNAADREEDEGLYAALGSIQAELDRANLGFVYQRAGQPPGASLAAASTSPATNGSVPPPRQAPPADVAASVPSSPPRLEALSDAEVICVIRPKRGAAGQSRVIVLDQPSRAFLEQLAWEQNSQAGRQATQWRPGTDRP